MAILRVTDTATGKEYAFPLLTNQSGQAGLVIESVPWQEGDPVVTWRIPLHDVSGGYFPSQHERMDTYDASSWFTLESDGTIGPAYTGSLITSQHPDLVADTYINVVYYQDRPYIWSSSRIYDFASKVNLNIGHTAIRGAVVFGNYLYVYSQSNTLRRVDSANNVTAATDDIKADAMGVVGDKLFMVRSGKVQFTTGDPMVAANWLPQSPNEYVMPGKDPYQIVDYGGTPYVCCENGVWAMNSQYEFKNQAPFMETRPHKDTAYGYQTRQAVVFGGYILVPYNRNIAVIGYGTASVIDSRKQGGHLPVRILRPWGEKLLAVSDGEEPYVGYGFPSNLVWHREHHMPNGAYASSNAFFFNNKMYYVTSDSSYYVYEWNESPSMSPYISKTYVKPVKDHNMTVVVTGYSFIATTNAAITVYYDNVYSVVKNHGYNDSIFHRSRAPIHGEQDTSVYSNNPIYQVKVSVPGKLMEMYLEGYAFEPNVETVSCVIAADDSSRVDGRLVGLSRGQMEWLFRDWMGKGSILELTLDDYMNRTGSDSVTPAAPMRCVVRKVMVVNGGVGPGGTRQGESSYLGDRLQVQFLRLKESGVHA